MSSSRDLARILAGYEQRLAKLEAGARTSQLQNASLTGTAITVYDEDGETPLQYIGKQGDGTVGTVAVNGPVPPAPSLPALTPGQLSLTVSWDSTFVDEDGDAVPRPADVEGVQVHVSTSSGFTPDASTLRGLLSVAGDLVVQPLTVEPHYVVLVAISSSKVTSDPSTEVSATPEDVVPGDGTITETKIADDSISTPKLQANSVAASKIAAGAVTAGKLESELVLGSRIIAGDPDAARVEMNGSGIEAHNTEGLETINVTSGGDVTIAGTIQSANFDSDTENGIVGWQLNQDGSVSISNATIGGSAFTINSEGNAAFNDLTVNDSDITIGGQELITDIINPLPRGIFALNLLPNDTAANSANGVSGLTLFGKIILPVIDPTRQYKVCGVGRFNSNSNSEYCLIRCYVAIDRDATTSDSLLFEVQIPNNNAASRDVAATFAHCFNNTTSPGQAMHFSFYFTAEDAGALNYQGTNYGRIWLEDAGLAVPYGTFLPSTPTTPPQQYTKTYSAVWSASYDSGGSRVAIDGEDQRQGYYSSSQGNQKSLIGFDYSQIASDLSGATIQKCEVYLYFNHWYFFDGGTAIIGTHSSTNTSDNGPTTYPSGSVNTGRKTVANWGRNVGKWVDLGTTIGNEFKSGTSKGIAMGPGTSNDPLYYGKYDGDNMTHEPKLRITYTK